nr:hypothetical protein [Tanacetum cinerariifolium]
PIYPEYIPLEDEHILSAEEQPLPHVVSPTVESPGYVAESDLEKDPEEYEEDDTEDGPVDYPVDRGDDGDDDDGDSSGYDADDEDEDGEDEEEEEEHLALANSTTSISLPPGAEVERLLVMPTPSPSPLTSLLPPSAGECLARCTAPTALPSPPLPPSLYPTPVDRRDDILESKQLPRKRLCLSTLGSRMVGDFMPELIYPEYIPVEDEHILPAEEQPLPLVVSPTAESPGYVAKSDTEEDPEECMAPAALPSPSLPPSLYPPPPIDRRDGIPESEQPPRKREVGYGIRDTWIDPAEAILEMVPTTLEKVNIRVTELAELHKHDTHDLYALLEDAQDVWVMDEEAYAAREAWAHSIGLSQTIHHELQTLREQSQIVETLRVMRDMRREMGNMQTELLALRGQPRRARRPRGDVRVPNHQDALRDAD